MVNSILIFLSVTGFSQSIPVQEFTIPDYSPLIMKQYLITQGWVPMWQRLPKQRP